MITRIKLTVAGVLISLVLLVLTIFPAVARSLPTPLSGSDSMSAVSAPTQKTLNQMGNNMGQMGNTMPMTDSLQVDQVSMAQMMQMMGSMMQMMATNMKQMDSSMSMTSTMSMMNSMPMNRADMGRMMQMMGRMMQMMGQMAQRQDSMMGAVPSTDYVPPVKGLYDEEEIFFIHTETSDADVAQMLTEMMGPQVLLLPELAEIPDALLAKVYVFTNGMGGSGPFGFQPDVFDAVPGDAGYRPLRTVVLVTWKEDATPRVLASVGAVQEAEAAGEVTIENSGIVVNMPILTWPGGHR